MARLSSWVLCSKWLSPPKRLFGCPPKSSLHWSHSLLRFFRQMAVATEKVLWRVLPSVLYIYLPVVCWGESRWIVDTSHPYKSRPQKNDPIMSLLLGYSLGVFLKGTSCGQNPKVTQNDYGAATSLFTEFTLSYFGVGFSNLPKWEQKKNRTWAQGFANFRVELTYFTHLEAKCGQVVSFSVFRNSDPCRNSTPLNIKHGHHYLDFQHESLVWSIKFFLF